MEDYKPNSHKSKEEAASPAPEKREVKPALPPKKKNNAEKLADIFVAEDIRNVKSYVFHDILVPAIKNTIFNICKEGLSMILFANTSGSGNDSSGSGRSYTRYYRSDRDRDYASRSAYDYRVPRFNNEIDANEVLDLLSDILERDGAVSVADLYDIMKWRANYTDNNYGWRDLRSAKVIRERDQYVLKLPRVISL